MLLDTPRTPELLIFAPNFRGINWFYFRAALLRRARSKVSGVRSDLVSRVGCMQVDRAE